MSEDIFNVAKIYKDTSVKTADGGKIIVMLYEKAIHLLDDAIQTLQEQGFRGYDTVNTSITKAQEIILELSVALDKTIFPELSENLFNLYMYFNKQLREANFEKSEKKILPVRTMLIDLLETWKEATKSTNDSSAQSSSSTTTSINIIG